MFEQQVEAGPAAGLAVGLLTAAVDALVDLDLSTLSRDELLALVRAVEVQRRRLPVIDHALIGELTARGTAFETGCANTAALLRTMLRLRPAEAKARVAAAADLGPRRAMSGAPLPPLFEQVACAQAEGSISPAHATVITDTVDSLPAAVQAEHAAAVEERLVHDAQSFDPLQLTTLARRISATLNPDGVLTAERDHQRRRSATLRAHQDGSGELTAHLTPTALAVWQAVLDPLAAPAPTEDDPDPRSPAQRHHDALLDAGQRLLRTADLPNNGGVPATVIITMTLDQLETRTGLATTSHGGLLSINDALHLATEARVIPTVLNDTGGILTYGRTRRTASAGQRLALTARDGGCSFPTCDVPPQWCQAHHLTPWATDGPTNLDNLTLLCGHHHREFAKRGWTITITNGLPHWTPPPWIDPTQTPRRNTMRMTGAGVT